MSERRYLALMPGQHPKDGRLLRRDAIFDADFGRRAPRWVQEVSHKTPLTDGTPEPNTPTRGESQLVGRAPPMLYECNYKVFD